MKKRLLTILILLGLASILSCQNNVSGTDSKMVVEKVRDSVLIFKTDSTKFYSFNSIDLETGKWKPVISAVINYHKIDLKDKSLTFFFKTKNQTEWDTRKMYYDSLTDIKTGTSFYYNSGYFESSFLDTLSSKTIAHVLNEDQYIRFTNLKRLDINELEKFESNSKQSNSAQKKKLYLNEQYQSETFEYSDYWRKEAFKKAVVFIQKILSEQNPKCTMIKRSSYNPVDVKYIGNQGMNVKLYVEYDCNQNYVNPSYFWVNAYYSGDGKWLFHLENQKLTH
jgi:hypothetical protein